MTFRWTAALAVVGTLAWHPAQAAAALVIRAENTANRTAGNPVPGGGWNIWGNGQVGQSVRVAAAGRYQIMVRAWGRPAGGIWPEMALLVDGRAVETVTVGRGERADYRFEVELAAGIHEIAAAYLNDAIVGREDRDLNLDRLTIGPPPGIADPVVAVPRQDPILGSRKRTVAPGQAEDRRAVPLGSRSRSW
jgi:Ca-dependent carbohydrate-binding module xylan-binding